MHNLFIFLPYSIQLWLLNKRIEKAMHDVRWWDKHREHCEDEVAEARRRVIAAKRALNDLRYPVGGVLR
jgi:predicted  nucleic acid-binding Zn-ribbon protein